MKILIVDDSALIRSILKQIVAKDHSITIVGEASNGLRAVELNRTHAPDLIIMDVNMPVMDGIEAARRIMAEQPTAVLIFTSDPTSEIRQWAKRIGTAEVMTKPGMGEINDPVFYRRFLKKIRALAESRRTVSSPHSRRTAARKPDAPGSKRYRLLVIGASTGGPLAVKEILTRLPGDFPLGIALVQHMEAGFDSGFARWLDNLTPLDVRLAGDSEDIRPGRVFIAPVDRHLTVKNRRLVLEDGPKILNQRPSVDILFRSAAKEFGPKLLGVLLTGMGRDGADGCCSILSEGGVTLVQDEATSAIFGMPKAAIEAGGASQVLALGAIPPRLLQLAKSGGHSSR